MNKKKIILGLLGGIASILIVALLAQQVTGQIGTNNSTAQTEENASSDEVSVISTSTDLKITEDESETYTN